MKCWLNLIFLFIFTCSSTCFGEVIIDHSTQRTLIGYGLERYTGQGEPDFADTSAASFQALESKVPNLGISPADIWFRLPVTNKGKEKLELLLEIAYPLLDEVELFAPSSNGSYKSIKLAEHQSF